MKKVIANKIRNIFNVLGYEVIKTKNLTADISIGVWINKLNISTIIDVGSNEGQFIQSINSIIPNRKIIAFEPIKEVYEKLLFNTRGLDILAYNAAASDENGVSVINVSKNFVSSSLLKMEDLHKNMYPESEYVREEQIELKRLDDVISFGDITGNILLKIDVQGYENKVIAGAMNTIKHVDVVIIEFSFQPIYKDQWLFDETYLFFKQSGFKFIGFADQITDVAIGIPVYGDAIFVRNELAEDLYKK